MEYRARCIKTQIFSIHLYICSQMMNSTSGERKRMEVSSAV